MKNEDHVIVAWRWRMLVTAFSFRILLRGTDSVVLGFLVVVFFAFIAAFATTAPVSFTKSKA